MDDTIAELLAEAARILRYHRHDGRSLIPLDASFVAGVLASVHTAADVAAAVATMRAEYPTEHRSEVSLDQLHLDLGRSSR